jgi:hypothetical protein
MSYGKSPLEATPPAQDLVCGQRHAFAGVLQVLDPAEKMVSL